MNVCEVMEDFVSAMQRIRKDANCGFVRDWEVAEDNEGYRHIFVQDPLSLEWFEAFNEGQYKELSELCHA